MVVYLGLLGVAEPRQLSYPGGLVRDVPLVEGGQARGLQAVVGVPVARGRGGRMVRSLGCHVSKERLATRNASSNGHPGFPAFHVGTIVASFGAEVPYSALVVGVITKVPSPDGEPVIPAWGHEGFVLDAAEVLTDEGGPVASRIEARCHVVLLVAFVPVGLPPAARLPTSLLVHTPVLWAYWPRMMVARLGQQSALETKAFEKLMPLALNAWCELFGRELSGRCPRIRVGLPIPIPEGKGTDSWSMWTPSSPYSTSWSTTSASPVRKRNSTPDQMHP